MADEKTAELPTGLYWKGKKTEVERIALPFQTIEIINESRATREKEKGTFLRATPDTSWYNRLIWGDNKYIIASLLEDLAGQIDLIYIDPPFFAGTDQTINVRIAEEDLIKEPSVIEEFAYRNTWNKGIDGFCQYMYDRLSLMYDLLKSDGTIFVRYDWRYGHYIKILLDGIFGKENFVNEIIVNKKREQAGSRKKFEVIYEYLYFYCKGQNYRFNDIYVKRPLSDIKWTSFLMQEERIPRERKFFNLTLIPPKGQHFALIQDKCDKLVKENYIRLRCKKCGARFYYGESEQELAKKMKTTEKFKFYDINSETLYFVVRGLDSCLNCTSTNFAVDYLGSEDTKLTNNWLDIRSYTDTTSYPTENSESLLERIISSVTNKNDLVADFFVGSGTTAAVSERLGCRWIAADIGRFSIHTTRKRLLSIDQCKPFVVQNLGKYERQYWQGITFKKRSNEQIPVYEYMQFILDLYNAESISGMMHIHGKKGRRLVHVGAIDAPVTLSEIKEAVAEVKKAGQDSLDILGWEWEMGLHDVVEKEAKTEGVHLRLFNIPRDVMDPRAVEKGDVTFYELAYLEVEVSYDKHNKQFFVELKDFAIPNLDLIPPDVRDKIKKWSDYIDYWAVDWEWKQDIFHNMWQSYRTRKDRSLQLKTDGHTYETKGEHLIMVKVIDIFGNDTTRVVEVKS